MRGACWKTDHRPRAAGNRRRSSAKRSCIAMLRLTFAPQSSPLSTHFPGVADEVLTVDRGHSPPLVGSNIQAFSFTVAALRSLQIACVRTHGASSPGSLELGRMTAGNCIRLLKYIGSWAAAGRAVSLARSCDLSNPPPRHPSQIYRHFAYSRGCRAARPSFPFISIERILIRE